MEVLEAELWQLVDQRLDQVRRLSHEELVRRTSGEPEVELVERSSGTFRRRTRVVACPGDRLGIIVRVDAEGRRRPAEGRIIVTSSGALAPEWSRSGEPARGNPFAFGPRATLAGLALCAVLLLLFFLLA
jgi:hypothetical protein